MMKKLITLATALLLCSPLNRGYSQQPGAADLRAANEAWFDGK